MSSEAQTPRKPALEVALAASRIPTYMHSGLLRYIQEGVIPGGFLVAVITNDLKNACRAADENNKHLLFDYVSFLYNHAPAPCWGSVDHMKRWAEQRGMAGM